MFETFERSELRLIAEPGRYFASAAYTLAVNIIGGTFSIRFANIFATP